MKTKLMKRVFVVCMSIAITASPITANASAKKVACNDPMFHVSVGCNAKDDLYNKDRMVHAPSVECSVEAESTTNKKKGFANFFVINGGSNSGSTNNGKKTITYHVKLDSSYGFSGGVSATLTGYCTNGSGNNIAANFKTTFNFVAVGGGVYTIKDKEAKSSKSQNAIVSAIGGGETLPTINKVKTETVCSKKSYETKTLSCSSKRKK